MKIDIEELKKLIEVFDTSSLSATNEKILAANIVASFKSIRKLMNHIQTNIDSKDEDIKRKIFFMGMKLFVSYLSFTQEMQSIISNETNIH